MRIEDFLVSIGLFSVFVVIFVAATANVVNNYADVGISVTGMDNSSSIVFDKATEIDAQAREMQEKVTDIPSGPLSAVTGFISAAWSTVISTLSGIGLIQSIVGAVADLIGVPAAISGFIMSAIIIVIVLMIAKLVFNLSEGS